MSVKIFYCYAHEDRKLRESLEKHLANLKQQKLITGWSDRNINAGKEWAKEIDINLNSADIILLLISPDFMNSDYCFSVEWHNRNEAFFDVARGIQKVVKELLCEQRVYEGNIHDYRDQYDEALAAFEQAIHFDPTNALAYVGKGRVLTQLASYADGVFEQVDYCESALAAFEQAICLDPNNACAYTGKGDALSQYNLGDKKEEALCAYDQAIRLDSKNDATYIGKGNALMHLERYGQALAAYEKAIEVSLFPNLDTYKGQGDALYHLKRYDEALTVYEKVIQEFPKSGSVYKDKGDALYKLECYDDALASYYNALALDFQSAPLYWEIGNLLCLLGYNQKALNAFEQAIRLDSDDRFHRQPKWCIHQVWFDKKDCSMSLSTPIWISKLGMLLADAPLSV